MIKFILLQWKLKYGYLSWGRALKEKHCVPNWGLRMDERRRKIIIAFVIGFTILDLVGIAIFFLLK